MDPMTWTYVLLGLAGLGLVSVFTSGAKTGRKAERATREVTRLSGNAVRTLITAVVIVGVQWAVIELTTDPVILGVTLALPALFAAVTVARLLAVTEVVRTVNAGRRGGGRR